MVPELVTDSGAHHLKWIGRFHLLLLPLGSLAWLIRSPWAAGVFLAGGLGSLAFWHLHGLLVVHLLTPSLRRRWFYGFLVLVKLVLFALYLRAMMRCFTAEVLPLTTGVLLFVVAILMEAGRLVLAPQPPDLDGTN